MGSLTMINLHCTLINPNLYGVFWLPILYGGGGKKPPGLTLALDLRQSLNLV